MNPDVIIVGGGAAGCFAAVTAARRGRQVLLLDGNDRLGHKLSITGKGRCNLTNNCDRDTLMQNIPRGGRLLFSALSRCTPQDVMAFFEAEGVPLKTERGRRVFPVSDRAQDIVQAPTAAMQDPGVRVRLGARVRSVTVRDGCCTGVRLADGTEISAESVLLATGGMSYPRTGSTGDGLRMAEKLGLAVTPMQPALIPLETAESDPQEMQGLALKNVTLTVTRGKKRIFSEMGELLFTHFGVSGPVILSASSHIREMERGRYKIGIDLKPALNEEQLDARILRDFSENINRNYINALNSLLPKKLVPVIVKLSRIPMTTKVNQITKEQRRDLAVLLKNFTVTVTDYRPVEEAIVTSGGVDTKQINPKTMESKLVRGLYFAGEVIDVDAYTGGFNLQIAFSTGRLAAQSAADALVKGESYE
jgi:predicted Rossmann fold flavoprotein